MARLSVDLNRDGLHEIAAPSAFETDGPFEIRLRNHGEAVHVHLNLDDSLSEVAALAAGNHFVEADSYRSVQINTRPVSAPVTGRLKIVTAYGSKSTYCSVTVSPPGTITEHVDVDEQLAKPQRHEPEPSTPRERLAAAVEAGLSSRVAAAGTIAVSVGLVSATLMQSATVFLGSLAMIAAAVAAVAITRRT